jgi:phage terminase large subunit
MQQVGKEIRFIDYYENIGQGMDHYAKILKEKNYNYGDHYMPHDAASKSIQTGKTTRDYAEGLGIRPIQIVQRAKDSQAILAGIESGRSVLSQCWFDKKKCAKGLSALETYQAEWDESKKILASKPKHDWTSHAADAFRTFSVGYLPKLPKKTVTSIMSNHNYSGVW